MELKTWPAREIPLLVFGFDTDDAEKEAWSFIRLHGWKAKVGKVEELDSRQGLKLEKDHRATFQKLI